MNFTSDARGKLPAAPRKAPEGMVSRRADERLRRHPSREVFLLGWVSAGARLIVEESVADELVAEWPPGGRDPDRNGLDPASETGPLVSAAHRAKYRGLRRVGPEEGARGAVGRVPPRRPGARQGATPRPHRARRAATAGSRWCARTRFGRAHRGASWSTRVRPSRSATTRPTRAGGRRDATRRARTGWPVRLATARCGSNRLRATCAGRRVGPDEALRQRPRARLHLTEYQEQRHIWHNTAPAPARWFT